MFFTDSHCHPYPFQPYNTLSTGFLSLVGRYTLGDKLQDVAATDHSVCTGRVNSCSNTLGLHVAATNRFACTGEFVWKSLSLQQNFDVATSRKKSNQTEFVRLVAATKFFCSHKNLHKNSPVHSERFVAATCRIVHVPICGWNPLVLTFKLNLFGRTFEDCYLCFRISEKGFDSFKTFFLRLQLEVKGLH